MRTLLAGVVLITLLGFWAACDTAPGPTALGLRPPLLSDLTFTPPGVVLEQLSPEQIDGDSVRVPFTVGVTAVDPDGAIEEVQFIVQSPLSQIDPVAVGALSLAGRNLYDATQTITLSRGAVGSYTVVVYAVDGDKQLSGEIRGTFDYVATGQPPVIEELEVPETVTRPAAGEPPVIFQYIAVVSDPDGLDNVATVEVDIEDFGILRLCDDGGEGSCNTGFPASGDAVAADGRFTLTLQIDSDNQADTLKLLFKAIDRTGLESEVVERTFTIL